MGTTARYLALNVNIDKLVFSANLKKDINKEPEYLIDLREIRSSYCTRIDWRPNNALFHQIKKAQEQKNFPAPSHPEAALFKSIIFADFSDYLGKLSPDESAKLIDEVSGEERLTPYTRADHVYRLLSKTQGITVIFEDGETVKFIPFDKSASMARANKISYIREDLYELVDEKLRLGFDFNSIPMELSKYFAYRGLYLSSSQRVPIEMDEYDLNEETVIVIPDYKEELFNDDQTETKIIEGKTAVNAFPPIFEVIENKDPNADREHVFSEERTSVEVNVFDGEGLISPRLSEYINSVIHQGEENATSFQIRMPFIKGMLHTVDYHKFANEYISNADSIKIKDIYGIERDLSKVNIILTASMFKCKNWIKEFISKGTDPMKLFFQRFHKYDHTIYIANDNTMLSSNGIEQLNYQFLSTLAMSEDDFNSLIDAHKRIGKEKIENSIKVKTLTKFKNSKDIIAKAAFLNDNFYNEPQLINKVSNELRNLRIDLGMGSLYTKGYNKFLSGDLLLFLIYLFKECGNNLSVNNQNEFESIQEQCLTTGAYMPARNETGEFALYRSPHLSQNEDCLSSPNIRQQDKNKQKDSVYESFFSELKGIIMVPHYFLIPMTLSGADFDGDLVKTCTDEKVITAIHESSYDPDKKMEGLVRKKSIVYIPGAKGSEETPNNEKRNIKVILNTFSGQTGFISNLGLSFALNEYIYENGKPKTIDTDKDYCAFSTAVTGLEIDAAKKGSHPVKDIIFLTKQSAVIEKKKEKYNSSKYFTDCKNTFKQLKSQYYKVIKDEQKDKYTLQVSNYNIKNIEIGKPSDGAHNLLRLPYEFAEKEYYSNGIQDAKKLLNAPANTSEYFKFEKKNPCWKNTLNKDTLKEVASLIDAFYRIKKDTKEYEKDYASIKYSKASGKLNTILKIKYGYDQETGKLPQSIDEALSKTILFIETVLDNQEKALKALANLNSYHWEACIKNNRVHMLHEILMIDQKIEIESDIICLLCDFTCSGYYILYHLIKMILKQYQGSLTPKAMIGDDKIKQDNKYYQEMLNLYKPKEEVSYRRRELGDYIESWNETLGKYCYSALIKMFCEGSEPQDSEISNMIMYCWYLRNKHDKNGTFFWNVFKQNEKDLFANINDKNHHFERIYGEKN